MERPEYTPPLFERGNAAVNPIEPVCPFVDLGDARCAARLTLLNLRETFQFCAGQHSLCTIYQQITLEKRCCNIAWPVARSA